MLQLREVHETALINCLRRLELHYVLLTDTSTGQGAGGVTQKLSQVRLAIGTVAARLEVTRAARGTPTTDAPAAQGVSIRGRSRPDYTVAEGDETST